MISKCLFLIVLILFSNSLCANYDKNDSQCNGKATTVEDCSSKGTNDLNMSCCMYLDYGDENNKYCLAIVNNQDAFNEYATDNKLGDFDMFVLKKQKI